MRAFSSAQQGMFLSAFGQEIINLNDGASFSAIVENRPIVIEGAEGLIESYENYFTTRKYDFLLGDQIALELNNPLAQVIPNDRNTYTIYNIENDLSGMVNYYFRME
ncbi:hypothetical protein VC636_25655 [Citrobacter freundii]|uniref:hypothetical protein n=1 Tax=Citrobacter freundii TaxID=546 RepID=UPI00292B0444|nr:hypothetical protein [Citrobacter freundii]MDV0678317.1 hypothetical protein [Citrobacter freundii]MDV0860718.1 hypothetical protein [Citrobacter freundii]MEB0577850.1 hypothetical protein [Citrobacter freundii]MEB0714205.1 hypothetical protein [Citrobacter freundii]